MTKHPAMVAAQVIHERTRMGPVRLLLLTNSLQMGGIETNVVRLAREFNRRGHEVLAATSGGALVPELEAAGGRHLNAPLTPLANPVQAMAELRRVVRISAPHVIHAFSATATLMLWAALRLPPVRPRPVVISSIMGLQNRADESTVLIHARAMATAAGVDRLLVIAPSIEALLRSLPISERRLERSLVVGVDQPDPGLTHPDQVAAVRDELGLRTGERLVVTVGALEPRKSPELFVRAAATAARRPDTRFLMVGAGSLESSLRKAISDLGVDDRIALIGQRTDALRFIAAADVCVRPGIVEGFAGITVLEAQMLGIPVVAFETEDVKLAIDHERTGLLVPPGDTEALASAITRVLDDHDLARRLGEEGWRVVRDRFRIDRVVDELEAVYERECRRRGFDCH